MSLKAKRNTLYVASVIAQLLPLLITFILQWDKWVVEKGADTKVSTGVSLAFGGILCVVMMVLSLLDKLPKANGLLFSTIIFVIICLLEPLIKDLKLLVGMYLLGKAINWLFFEHALAKVKKEILMDENGNVTTAKIKQLLDEREKGK